MLKLRTAALLMAWMVVGCSATPRSARVDTRAAGEIIVHIPRTAGLLPVLVEEEEFQQATRQLAREATLRGTARETAERAFQMDALSGNYLYLPRDRKLVPAGPSEPLEGALTKEDLALAERYRLWCREVHGFYGDCLGGALVAGRYLDMQGRYMWALALSKSPVLEEMKKALGDMVNFRAVFNAALWTGGSMLLILAVNPVAPGLVAVMGVGLVLYVGYDTLHNLVAGWRQLTEEVKYATTFGEIREAGERFGKILGEESARAFAMLLIAAMGRTAQDFAAMLPKLPGAVQVAAQAEAQVGISLPALAMAEEVAITAEGVRVVLPPGAVAMAARASRSENPCIESHHIATICNDKSTARGGPWTPRFRRIFAKAGMKLDDPANKLPVQGHQGPHPERYHQIVHSRLDGATKTCRSIEACRKMLLRELADLAKEIATPGTELNLLVTRARPK